MATLSAFVDADFEVSRQTSIALPCLALAVPRTVTTGRTDHEDSDASRKPDEHEHDMNIAMALVGSIM